jgi:predicted GNAT family acetyltransferase
MNHTESITVRSAPAAHRYELVDGETVVAAAYYLDFTGSDPVARIFYHTTVDDDHSGRGLGSRLAKFALDDTLDLGLVIVALCPFINAYVKRHSRYQARTISVRPEHLAALSDQLSNW